MAPFSSPHRDHDIVSERKLYVPEGYLSADRTDRTGRDIASEPDASAASSIVPVWTIQVGSTRLRARQPMPIKITTGDDHFLFESESLGVYAAGKTLSAVGLDFCEQVIDSFYHYKALQARQVTGEARQLRRIYRALFVEEQIHDS